MNKISNSLSVVFSPNMILTFSYNIENFEIHDDVLFGSFDCVDAS